jgi:2-hydroxy-3-keto-5-methylthiopentenyl-1-phosphate phosphatase
VKKIAIISDFDGTVSRRDIGHHFFGAFVARRREWLALLDEWRLGLISSRECLERELSLVRADRDDLDGFVDGEGLDPYFKDFVDFCALRGIDLLIASDGLDYYIDRLLIRFGLGFLPFRANRLVCEGARLAALEFPYYNRLDCTRCGNCKRWHLEGFRNSGCMVMYVGNGYSDRCPAEHADLVFAKGELLDHCRERDLPYVSFENFRDVEREITTRFILHSGNISL